MNRKIVIIIILLIVLFVIYKNKEKFTSDTLPKNIDSLPEDIKKVFDSSYFLSDFTFVEDNNNYTLINKNINKYEFDLIYHDTNKQLVKGAFAQIPSSQVYYFLSLSKITFKENDDINFTLNLVKDRTNDLKDYLLENGINKPQFIYMEFPYVKDNKSGMYGIFVIFNSGKILFNLSEKYYYVNQLNDSITDKAVFTNKYGLTNFIDIIKNNKITQINISSNEFDSKNNPKNYKLIDFKIDKTEKTNEVNEIFEIL
jgi:hypothetical protein